jgi:hypothetical protein
MAANEPIDSTDPADPMLPIDSTDPTLQMDRTEPREPIERTELVDQSDMRELEDGMIDSRSGLGGLRRRLLAGPPVQHLRMPGTIEQLVIAGPKHLGRHEKRC